MADAVATYSICACDLDAGQWGVATQSKFLAVGSIVPKPVVEDGQVTVRRRLRLTMSCDHRVIDGATGAAFMKTLKQMLENPLAMLL